VSWEGETTVSPPAGARSPEGVRLDDDWSPEGFGDARARPVRPDAVLEIEHKEGFIPQTVLVEYDRTQRIDKNYDKFRRYDMYLNWWWRETEIGDAGPPIVVFVCQELEHCQRFVSAADHELTGHLWHPDVDASREEHVARRRIYFVRERDVHDVNLRAWRVPKFPPRHPAREAVARRVLLPGSPAPGEPEQLALLP